ncbi:MAG: hypothetical protein IT423_11820 [Pirellulaceae bacterium]|nr:hypothetical protein [Pirellulaceae bacterium]
MQTLILSRHLLWKDYRQVRPALIGLLLIQASLILLFFIRQMVATARDNDIFPVSFSIVLVAPTLVAMACSGILIGHERQTRTWNWSSSLPVSWASSLISKTIVWAVGSLVLFSILLALYGILFQICVWNGYTFIQQPEWTWSTEAWLMTALLVPLEVYVCFSLAALIWDDTLAALVLSAIFVGIMHLLLALVIPHWLFNISANQTLRFNGAGGVGMLLALVVLVGGGSIGLSRVFRWRWGIGQTQQWLPRGSSTWRTALSQRRVAWRPTTAALSQPSEFIMLLNHAVWSSMGLRALIVVGSIAFAAAVRSPAPTIVAACLLGVTTFSGDHNLSRYRFLSDRGVSWWKLLLAHASVPFLLSIGIIVALVSYLYATDHDLREPGWGLLSCFAAFLIGLFASLCTSASILSVTLAIGTLIIVWISYILFDNLWVQWIDLQHLALAPTLTFSTCILLAAIMWQARRWLTLDQSKGIQVYLITLVTSLALPIFIALNLAFLTVPYSAWQGVPVEQIGAGSPRRLPPLKIQFTAVPMRTPIYRSYDWTDNGKVILDNWATEFGRELTASGQSARSEWLENIKLVETELNARDEYVDSSIALRQRYSQLIETTALVGVHATRSKDAPLAIAAWKANHRLLEEIDMSAFTDMEYLTARWHTLRLWDLISEEEWKFLAEADDVSQLLPKPIPVSTFVQIVRQQYSIPYALMFDYEAFTADTKLMKRFSSDYGYASTDQQTAREIFWVRFALNYVPPVRWYVQRLMSANLASNVNELEGKWISSREYGGRNVPKINMRPMENVILMQQLLETRLRDWGT